MINSVYALMLSIMPKHNDAPFSLTPIKDGASVYMFGTRKALLQRRKDHLKVTIYSSADNPIVFKVFSVDILRAYPEFEDSVLKAYVHAKENETLETFGCCNSFVACSDAMRCLHDNDNYYRGCIYRKNMEAGRIYYGKNRNV